MIHGPPGEPSAMRSLPPRSNTIAGAMLLRGRLRGRTSFAEPGVKSKSVSWLLSRKPRTMIRLPNGLSMVLLMATTLPVGASDRLGLQCAVPGEILLGQIARLCMRAHRAHDLGGDRSAVESAYAFECQGTERRAISPVHEPCTCRPGFPVRAVIELPCKGILLQEPLALEHCVQPRGDDEAILRGEYRVLQQLAPWQAPVLPVRKLEQPQHARNAHRAPAHGGCVEFHGSFTRVQKTVRPRGRRRRLAAIVGAKPLLLLRPVQQEGAAADPRGFRLDQAEDHLHSDRGIERAAAELQHRVAGFGGERMRRGHNELLRGNSVPRICNITKKKKGDKRRPSHSSHSVFLKPSKALSEARRC